CCGSWTSPSRRRIRTTVCPTLRTTPPSSVDYLVSFALSPLGLVAAGAVIGVRTTLLIGGAISAMCTFVPLLPGVRDPDRPGSAARRRANEPSPELGVQRLEGPMRPNGPQRGARRGVCLYEARIVAEIPEQLVV